MKSQFQSTEKLRIRLTPFVNSSTGSYVLTGADTCILTIEKPDGSVYTGSTVSATWDSVAKLWYYDILAVNYVQGEWRVYAVSSDATSLQKWAVYLWGDYVDDITLARTAAESANTRIGTPGGASVSADLTAVKTKTDNLPTDPADASDVAAAITAAVTSIKGAGSKDITQIDTKLGTPAGASVSADVATAAASAASAQSSAASAVADTTILKKAAINRWKVQGTQLLMYENDGTTIYKTFDLKDDAGLPSATRIFERVPV
jgi:hypothetical protein